MSESKSNEPVDFETSLGELEQLVEQLESGELSLADSLGRFERGVKLSKHCHAMLDEARRKVEIMTRNDDEDSAVEFEPDSDNDSDTD